MTNVVIINDEPIEYQPGESLFAVARRNASHIGLLCDGDGICQACISQIVQGHEHVNDITNVERSILPETKLQQGYRLACATRLTGSGPVSVLTRAEELRRQFMDVLSPPEGTSHSQNLGHFVNNVNGMIADQLTMLPSNALATFRRLRQVRVSRDNLQHLFSDSQRITNRMLTNPKPESIQDS